MVTLKYADTMQLVAGGDGWTLDLSTIADAITHADDGTIRRFRPQNRVGSEAIPVKHVNRLQVAAATQGTTTAGLLMRREGTVFAFDDTVDMWTGGPFVIPGDTKTVPLDNLITRPLVFFQGDGPWHDGAEGHVREVNIRTGSLTIENIPLTRPTDKVFLWLSTGADASVRLSVGGNQADSVDTDGGGVFEIPTNSIPTGVHSDAELTASGIGSGEMLVGWLFVAPEQGKN